MTLNTEYIRDEQRNAIRHSGRNGVRRNGVRRRNDVRLLVQMHNRCYYIKNWS